MSKITGFADNGHMISLENIARVRWENKCVKIWHVGNDIGFNITCTDKVLESLLREIEKNMQHYHHEGIKYD